MGLKLMDLGLCSLRREKVRLHTTGKEATVSVKYVDRSMVFFLHFDDGGVEEVLWSADLQGFCDAKGDELDAVEELAPGVIT